LAKLNKKNKIKRIYNVNVNARNWVEIFCKYTANFSIHEIQKDFLIFLNSVFKMLLGGGGQGAPS
jgi:hypothetical protein